MKAMMRRLAPWAIAALVAAPLIAPPNQALAADHRETSRAQGDPAADIADVYAWHATGAGTLTAIVTYGGGADVDRRTSPLYDKDVLYTINIDNTDDSNFQPDEQILVRFGQNNIGEWGIQVVGLPGADATIVGPVGTTITSGTKGKVRVGLYDDPFFFDLTGFKNTLQTGTVDFDDARDGFAGKNVMAIVLEMDLAAATGGNNKVRVWATTGRKS
ncbi:MAG: DUF4331 family protein [Candidatus Eisenbacteria bacterium]|nr:DUF4331 family protein [Candidatus Eisenbacteria bacterium]MCC7143714.1 DUF4331 family protein [Candidatus Eisenbacteria bacterium]